ncbi:MAG: hypothetical protein WCO84_06090 [bacterium]
MSNLKPFPHDKISDEMLDLIVDNGYFKLLLEHMIERGIEIPEDLSNKLIDYINSPNNEEDGNYSLKRKNISGILYNAEISDYSLPESFIVGIIRSENLGMWLKYEAVKACLETTETIPFIVDRFLDSQFYGFMYHIIDNWNQNIQNKYWKNPKFAQYKKTLSTELRREISDAIKSEKMRWNI